MSPGTRAPSAAKVQTAHVIQHSPHVPVGQASEVAPDSWRRRCWTCPSRLHPAQDCIPALPQHHWAGEAERKPREGWSRAAWGCLGVRPHKRKSQTALSPTASSPCSKQAYPDFSVMEAHTFPFCLCPPDSVSHTRHQHQAVNTASLWVQSSLPSETQAESVPQASCWAGRG